MAKNFIENETTITADDANRWESQQEKHKALALEVEKKIYKPDSNGIVGQVLAVKDDLQTQWISLPKAKKIEPVVEDSIIAQKLNELINALQTVGIIER